MTAVLEIAGLTRRFGRNLAVDGLDLSLERGEVLGFLGPNGAGKSTTMRTLAGVLPADAGLVRVCGLDLQADPVAARSRMGYLAEGAPLYADMTAGQLLRFVARVRGLRGVAARRAVDDAVARLELGAALDRPIETLSKGFTRRVGLAQAILHGPDLLLLDEPTDGLDPNQKAQVRALLAELAADRAILISTHILEEVEAMCARCAVISRGRLVADDTPAGLRRRSRRHGAVGIAVPAGRAAAAAARLRACPEVAAVEREAGAPADTAVLLALPAGAGPLQPVVRAALAELLPEADGIELWTERGRLDDVFRDLTRADGAAEPVAAC
jgi:ABC-2 type transport system ATP-binding protein